jgi:prevent-host-death family protein
MAPKRAAMNLAEAKRDLSSLVARVAFGGETITITRRGRPMALLVPFTTDPRRLGDVKGWLDDDDPFFASVEESTARRRARPARVLSRARTAR